MAQPAGHRVMAAARRVGLEPHEVGTLAWMGALIAVLFCGYTIAKVLRDALFLSEYGAYALPYAYIGVAFASAGFVWLEGHLERRFTRVGAMRANQYLSILFGVLTLIAYRQNRHWTAGVFYLWTGSQMLLLISHFWVLALDVWDSRRARTVFPWLSGCGLIGGLVGGGIAAWLTPLVKRFGLMTIVIFLFLVAHALTLVIERRRSHTRRIDARPSGSRWQIVRRSPYIQVFVAGLALSVIVSTLVDWQFKLFIQRLYPDPHALAEFLGTFYVGLNALALVFQFGVAGWLLQRVGLGASTGLQPGAVLMFASWMAAGAGAWVIVAMRWVQGVVFQTLGKSSAEIYFAAIRPNDRRRIKPAIDTLVERWSDAAVGVLLIVALRMFHVSIPVIAIVTGALAAAWVVVLVVLDRLYGRAFATALANRWIAPEEAAESMRIPSARAAVLEALRSGDERRIVLALRMSGQTRAPAIVAAVRECLSHPSAAVRLAAVQTMEALRAPDPDGVIEGFLHDSNEALREAAVKYLLALAPHPEELVRRWLETNDAALRRYVVDAWFENPRRAVTLFEPSWVERQIASSAPEERWLAARALGGMSGRSVDAWLRTLLADPDLEVRRAALQSAARRPHRQLLEDLVPLLFVPELTYEAGLAVAAIGEPAIPVLRRLLGGAHGPRGQSIAANTMAAITSPRAVHELAPLVRSSDVWLRHLGLQALVRARLRSEEPVLSREMAHRSFLRELREYRECLEPARGLESHPAREVRLLAQSYRESADMALERGLRALACWYEPRPLFGVYEPLRSRDPDAAAPALEYLSHVLPRLMFKPVSRVFEHHEPETATAPDRLAEWIREAWESEDPWLRACAVRASRHTTELDPAMFVAGGDEPEIVRLELQARHGRTPIGEPSRC